MELMDGGAAAGLLEAGGVGEEGIDGGRDARRQLFFFFFSDFRFCHDSRLVGLWVFAWVFLQVVGIGDGVRPWWLGLIDDGGGYGLVGDFWFVVEKAEEGFISVKAVMDYGFLVNWPWVLLAEYGLG
ncbi:hypothetical protein M0R45_034802 [Rubus argutus]|uniref:Transmembrane protein n=1 Tax=Rubus argutus TaxID=59490 RepID=A0AAW1VU66_RUBAR